MPLTHAPAAVASKIRFTVTAPQPSDAVGAVKLGVPVHSIVALGPTAPIVGGVVSITVIIWLTVALWLPQASTASHVSVLV